MGFSLLAPFFTGPMLTTPKAFIATLAGIALSKVLQRPFTSAFKGVFSLGASIAFMVTVSDIVLFNIGAPFWGLVFGFIASLVLEGGSYAQR
jgi:benzoate membrane transport protein